MARRTRRTDPRVTAAALLGASLGLILAVSCEASDASRDDGGDGRRLTVALKMGTPTLRTPAVGMLLARSCPSGRCGIYARCSGVLGSRDRFFTAGHCLPDREATYWVFVQRAGIMRAAGSGVVHFCDGRDDCDPEIHDLAGLRLDRPFAGITPPGIGRLTGETVQIAGYGDSGPSFPDHGILRTAAITVRTCREGLICYRFTPDSSAACNHDSGGPMFDSGRIVGLARRSERSCSEGRGSFADLTIPTVAHWWRSLTLDPVAPVTAGEPVLSIDCVTTDCWLQARDSSDFTVEIAAGAGKFTVTLNHALLARGGDCAGGLHRCAVDFDLYVAGPRNDDRGSGGCVCRNEFYQVAACECSDPAPGSWRVTVRSTGAKGPFQLAGAVTYDR